jgi:Ca2+-binding EF-hand superfamily protein
LEHLTSRQISEWEAFDRLDPVNREWRADFRMAYMASLFINTMVKVFGKKGARMIKFDKFMPEWDRETCESHTRQTVQEMKDTLLSVVGQQNKKIKRDKKIRERKPSKKVRK